MIIVLMGVSGSGKSTVGKELKKKIVNYEFYDGDDFHPESNKIKMAQGLALTDEDRRPWLCILADLIEKQVVNGANAIVVCSALKKEYRKILNINKSVVLFVHLKISFDEAEQRLKRRKMHFFNAKLLQNQYETLQDLTEEENLNYHIVNCDKKTNEEIINNILFKIRSS